MPNQNCCHCGAPCGWANIRFDAKDFCCNGCKTVYSLIQRLGVAGFAFGIVMLLSLLEFFGTGEFWLDRYKWAFRYLIFAFSIPVILFSAQPYFVSANKGLGAKVGLYMLLFGLGTVPMMSPVALSKGLSRYSLARGFNKSIPIFVVSIGILYILRGLGLGIPYVSPEAVQPQTVGTSMECL